MGDNAGDGRRSRWLGGVFSRKTAHDAGPNEGNLGQSPRVQVWAMGMLNDKETIEVPGSVLLLASDRNEPLGLRNTPARTSHSSLPTGVRQEAPPITQKSEADKKTTKDGQFILDPQPDDSHNDPLNWPAWRRDVALMSLGFYCMIGGGITPIIAAGFTNVASDYNISVASVSLTTGLYMTGLGIGSVIFSPTAILYGKRPVYLFSSVLFILSSVWCALSPNFVSLIIARIVQGIAVSPVECLPSATIAEIFFLHERAYRIGIYTLLLLGGKNLVPLVSAAIIQSLSWRWVFWIVAIIVGFSGALLFFWVPETFWDRSPVPRARHHSKRPGLFSRQSSVLHMIRRASHHDKQAPENEKSGHNNDHQRGWAQDPHDAAQVEGQAVSPAAGRRPKDAHVGFMAEPEQDMPSENQALEGRDGNAGPGTATRATRAISNARHPSPPEPPSPVYNKDSDTSEETVKMGGLARNADGAIAESRPQAERTNSARSSISHAVSLNPGQKYTHALRDAPAKSYSQSLQIYHGRLNHDRWWKVALRPFILFAYPSVLWSAAIYACSVGWLIVISESVAIIYREGTYHFSALSTGLVYLSPFIGGVLGSAVAGRVSDLIVRAMARRNGGLYEPEFRLVMAIPILITTVVGLMGFGWSAGVNDAWIVPTIFFGVVSFGCSLGSTTAITFCVDSYRQYAGEALVTLNFSKNIFHGLVFSLFVTEWLTTAGSKAVFMWIGIIQLIVLLLTIPMYIYGKRARMWTARKNLVEKF